MTGVQTCALPIYLAHAKAAAIADQAGAVAEYLRQVGGADEAVARCRRVGAHVDALSVYQSDHAGHIGFLDPWSVFTNDSIVLKHSARKSYLLIHLTTGIRLIVTNRDAAVPNTSRVVAIEREL